MAVVFAQAAQEVTMARRRKSELQLEGLPARALAEAIPVEKKAASGKEMITLSVWTTAEARQRIQDLADRFGWTQGRVLQDALELYEQRVDALLVWRKAHESD